MYFSFYAPKLKLFKKGVPKKYDRSSSWIVVGRSSGSRGCVITSHSSNIFTTTTSDNGAAKSTDSKTRETLSHLFPSFRSKNRRFEVLFFQNFTNILSNQFNITQDSRPILQICFKTFIPIFHPINLHGGDFGLLNYLTKVKNYG